MSTRNYTLGRGKVYFARFTDATNQIPDNFFYIGNTPEFNLTIEFEELEHFSSDEGIREKDDSVPLEVTRTGSMITDDIDPRNVALFFFGTDETLTQASVAPATETLTGVQPGMYRQLGLTPANPTGLHGIDSTGFAVQAVGGGTTYTVTDDYRINFDTGLLEIVDGGAIPVGDIEVNYGVRASTRDRVISGSSPVEGAMMYIAANPKGRDFDYRLPYVKINPNGDYALKGDEWQQIPFTIEALKPNSGEAIYMDGRPIYS